MESEIKQKKGRKKAFVPPTLDDVQAYMDEIGECRFTAVKFWNYYEANGWRVGSHVMKSWTSACVTWQKREDARAARRAQLDAKMDEREAARQAHIDAKMDAREARRTSQMMRKPADNYIAPTAKDLEEVRRDYDF